MTDLRVPLAELPGLDPVGLRVRDTEAPNVWVLFCADDLRCLVGDPTTGAARSRLLDRVVLDLADSATRDRCARYQAQRVGLEVGCTAPGWWCQQDVWVLAVKRSHAQVRGPVAHVYSARPRWSIYVHGGKRTQVPALAALDPDDDRRLPDGSRWVDAAALALVCRAQGVTRG